MIKTRYINGKNNVLLCNSKIQKSMLKCGLAANTSQDAGEKNRALAFEQNFHLSMMS